MGEQSGASEQKAASAVAGGEDAFTMQIRRHQSSKVTQFLNLFYSFLVGILCAVASKKYLAFPKSVGTLAGLLSYLYNRQAAH